MVNLKLRKVRFLFAFVLIVGSGKKEGLSLESMAEKTRKLGMWHDAWGCLIVNSDLFCDGL